MSNSIYNIQDWSASTVYNKNDIVIYGGLYYYAGFGHTSSSSFAVDLSNGNWVGNLYNRGEIKPYFTWKHSFKASNKNTPRVKSIKFGDGYGVYLPDGINNLLLDYTLTFENRGLDEITAILHFLSVRNGSESFAWVAPAPRGQLARFICPDWSDVQEFFGNYSITCNFVQNPV